MNPSPVLHTSKPSDIETANTGTVGPDRTGIERAFDVIRNHTVHTKGYVMTALKFIEEFGNSTDKAMLTDLLREKDQASSLATSSPPGVKKKNSKKK